MTKVHFLVVYTVVRLVYYIHYGKKANRVVDHQNAPAAKQVAFLPHSSMVPCLVLLLNYCLSGDYVHGLPLGDHAHAGVCV